MLNSNFNFTTRYTEQDLVERLIVESIQIYGMDILYCPKTLVDYDALLGENSQRAFNSAVTVEAYFENVDGFMGDKNFLNKMGLNIDKQAVFIVAKRRFDEVTLGLNWRDFWQATNSYSPTDAAHYQGAVYINTSAVHNSSLTLTGVTGVFKQFDPVQGATSGATAVVKSFSTSPVVANQLTLSGVTGYFEKFHTVTGATSGATGIVQSFDPRANILIVTDVSGTFVVAEVVNDTEYSFPSPESVTDDTVVDFVAASTGTITAIVGTSVPVSNVLILNDVVGTFRVGEVVNDTLGNFPSPESVSGDSSINFALPASGTISVITAGTNIAPPTDKLHWRLMEQIRPKEGDLIYLPVTGDIFEILFADHEEVFYQLGKIYVWKITCEKFRYSHESLSTGITDIDNIATELENNDSIVNDPIADNTNISTVVETFLNLDPDRPF